MSSTASRYSARTVFLRRWGMLPPVEPEVMSADAARRVLRFIAGFGVISVLVDMVILATLWNVPAISRSALLTFEWVNVPILLLITATAYVSQQRPALFRRVAPPLSAAFCVTILVWIQLTGTVTSYFFVTGTLVVVFARTMGGWWSGVAAVLTMALGHSAIYLLENQGLLPRSSLLREPSSGLDALPAYRLAAMSSITGTYLLCFVGTQVGVTWLREQRRELERVRRDLAGLAEGVTRGRLSGTELGRWFVDELLGRGGMGEVYAAHDESGAQVAIKVLHVHLSDDQSTLQRFAQEQEAAARVGGKFFPTFIEVAQSDEGLPYFVMERLRGQDLGELLRQRQRLSRDEVKRLASALCAALDALHAQGITHRDLTPSNVFLVASAGSDWPNMRLLDLGMCKLRDAEMGVTRSSALLGTPGFMAPEQIDGPVSAVGPQTDVFACGCILYRALVGEQAFPAATMLEAIESVCRRQPKPPSAACADLPERVDAVFARALAKKPAERYGSAGELARALDAAL